MPRLRSCPVSTRRSERRPRLLDVLLAIFPGLLTFAPLSPLGAEPPSPKAASQAAPQVAPKAAPKAAPQTAEEPLPTLALPPSPPPRVEESSDEEAAKTRAQQERIRRALQGEQSPGEAPGSTGDPILDDVLQVIGREGSLLRGSVLDPDRDPTTEDAPPAPSRTGPASRRRFHAAESLLRSARLLEALPPHGAARRRLISELRREAARCLQRGLRGEAGGAAGEAAADPLLDELD